MSDAYLENWRLMARYNRLANERLYTAAGELSQEDLRVDLGAFFGSIHGTLNHLLLSDRIWMTRFEGGDHPSSDLDAVLYEDFDELWAARRAEDARIGDFFSAPPEGFFEGEIAYVNNAGKAVRDPVRVCVAHFFNHQTHHRGQVHAMLHRLAEAPSLDLHRLIHPA